MGREEDGTKEKEEIKDNPISEGSCVIYRDEEGWRGIFSFLPSVAAAKSLQSCPTLRDPTDGSPPGSLIPGILQARTLEWVAISFFPLKGTNSKGESRVPLEVC